MKNKTETTKKEKKRERVKLRKNKKSAVCSGNRKSFIFKSDFIFFSLKITNLDLNKKFLRLTERTLRRKLREHIN